MYDVAAHGRMIRDRVRSDAYARAISATVRPGDVVVDLGCGTGVLSILAARSGAGKVYAIESDDVIEVARELAVANGCADRIEFLRASSRAVSVPERANVVISDIHGVLPQFRTAIVDAIDARERFLAPGGIMIPARESLHAALIESPDLYAEYDWPPRAGIDFGPLRRLAMGDVRKRLTTSSDMLSDPLQFATIDYRTVQSPDLQARLSLPAIRDGLAHGLAIWFDAQLTEEIGFSNAPDAPETIYGRSFLPFEAPVPLRSGEAIGVDLAARLVNDDDYLWRWTTTHIEISGKERELFRQSNFFGVPNVHG